MPAVRGSPDGTAGAGDPMNAVLRDEPLWSALEAGKQLDKSRSWIYGQAKKGAIPFVWIGGEMKFDPEVIRAVKRGETVGTARIISIGRKKKGEVVA